MVWFRTDDSFRDHPKVRRINKRRRPHVTGVWHACGLWSAGQLTDGAIPGDVVEEYGGSEADAATLVRVGLWHGPGHTCERCPAVETGSFQFHDWPHYQPVRSKVLAERAAGAERQRLSRERRRAALAEKEGRSEDRSQAESRQVSHPMSQELSQVRHSDPTRPDPTPTPVVPLSSSSNLPGRGPADDDDRGAHATGGWRTMTPATAVPPGVDPDAEWTRFVDRNAGHPDGLRDPRAAWLGWLRVAGQRARPTHTPTRPECPEHPGQPTGSQQCPECAKAHRPAPDLRALRDAG